jgi:hypothetical protein
MCPKVGQKVDILGTFCGHFGVIIWTKYVLGILRENLGQAEGWKQVRKMGESYAHVCIDFWMGI